MPFSAYKGLGEAVKKFQIAYRETDFLEEIPLAIADFVRDDLQILLREGTVNTSEDAICEALVFPVLKEVWKQYRQKLLFWSHQTFYWSPEPSGIADYLIAARSLLIKVVFEQPYLAFTKAKKESDVDAAWAECLAEIVTAQQISTGAQIAIFASSLMSCFGNLVS